VTPYYDHAGIVIYHGDCREILPTIPAGSVDLVLTDPPYGMNRFATDGKDYLTAVGPALRHAWLCLSESGSMFVFTSTAEVVEVANALGQRLKRLLWLYKPADCTYPLAGWLLKSEAILWFVKGDRIGLKERRPFRHDCYIHNHVGMEGVEGHPTVKPLKVVRDLASRCPDAGVILDPFLGSGTTLVAAKQLGRHAIGIEIEERYCEIAAKRLAQEILPLEPHDWRDENRESGSLFDGAK
jgi:site-specific DNA-methyltransferase (adenine-specific)